MDFYRIECFLAAAETGSMTKAAEKMCVTQPAISFQIRELERELQITLFSRESSGIRLTEAGKIMQTGFLHMMDSYRRFLDKALSCQYGKVRLTIGYHGFINWAGIHSFIAAFTRRHPEIEVSILQQQIKELADYLELGTLDVAFVENSELRDRGLELGTLDVAFVENSELRDRGRLSSLPLFQEKTCFAVPLSHPLADRDCVTIDDLKNETIVMNNHPSVCMNELIANLIRSGIRQEQFHFVDQPDVALALSVAGIGLTSLPISFRQDSIPLRYVEYDTPVCRMSYSLACRSDTENPAVRLFCGEVSRTDWPYAES